MQLHTHHQHWYPFWQLWLAPFTQIHSGIYLRTPTSSPYTAWVLGLHGQECSRAKPIWLPKLNPCDKHES